MVSLMHFFLGKCNVCFCCLAPGVIVTAETPLIKEVNDTYVKGNVNCLATDDDNLTAESYSLVLIMYVIYLSHYIPLLRYA